MIINRHSNNVAITITSKLSFFRENVIITDTGMSLIFTKPTIDYNGKLYKPHLDKKSKYYRITFTSLYSPDIPAAVYEVDISEDEIIMDYS